MPGCAGWGRGVSKRFASDARGLTGVSPPCWSSELFLLGPEPARTRNPTRDLHARSTSNIHCGDLHRTRCIVPGSPLGR